MKEKFNQIGKSVDGAKMNAKAFIITIVLIVLGVALVLLYNNMGKQKAVPFIPLDGEDKGYSSVEAIYMTEYFASDEYKYYYFVGDNDGYVYIIAVGKGVSDTYKDFIAYSYSEDETLTHDPVMFEGMPKQMSSELKELVKNSYNDYLGSDYSDDEILSYSGIRYLEVGSQENDWMELIGILLAFFASAFLIVLLISSLIVQCINAATRKKLTPDAADEIITELETGSVFPACRAAVTENFVISNSFGLRIFKKDEILNLHTERVRINYIPGTQHIKLRLKNGKTYTMGSVAALAKSQTVEQEYFRIALSNMLYQRDNEQAENLL